MNLVLLLVRLLLAAVFIMAGVAKLVDLRGSRRAFIDFGVPIILAPMLGLLLPLSEQVVAMALVPRLTA